jgi:hypothetical protein
MSCCIGYIRQLKEKITIAIMSKSLHAPHGSEMEESHYAEEDLSDQRSERPPIPYLPGRYEEVDKF